MNDYSTDTAIDALLDTLSLRDTDDKKSD